VTLAVVAPTVRQLVGLPRDTSPESGRPIEEIVGTDSGRTSIARLRP
jgi:hypothetical protein